MWQNIHFIVKHSNHIEQTGGSMFEKFRTSDQALSMTGSKAPHTRTYTYIQWDAIYSAWVPLLYYIHCTFGKNRFFSLCTKYHTNCPLCSENQLTIFLGFRLHVFFLFSCAIYANDNIYILHFNRFCIHRILDWMKAYHQSQDVIRSNGNWFSILMVISMRCSFELVGASINCLRGGIIVLNKSDQFLVNEKNARQKYRISTCKKSWANLNQFWNQNQNEIYRK